MICANCRLDAHCEDPGCFCQHKQRTYAPGERFAKYVAAITAGIERAGAQLGEQLRKTYNIPG